MKIKRFALGPLWTNCYVVCDSAGNGVIIDPSGPAGEVEDYVCDKDIHIAWILLTHAHCDHIGGIPDLINLADNGVAVHYKDTALLTNSAKNLSTSILPSPISLSAPDRELCDGDILNVGALEIKTIFTPGHTPGSCCYLITEGDEQVLVSGDTLFARSIGRSDLPGGDEHLLLESLKKFINFDDKLKILPGHGPETSIGEEREHNPYWPA